MGNLIGKNFLLHLLFCETSPGWEIQVYSGISLECYVSEFKKLLPDKLINVINFLSIIYHDNSFITVYSF